MVSLKYYPIPHSFRFFRFRGKCIMQYKLFAFHELWLPEIPPTEIDLVNEQLKQRASSSTLQLTNTLLTLQNDDILLFEEEMAPRASIIPEVFSCVGGRAAFLSSLGLKSPYAKTTETSADRAVLETMNRLQDAETVIQELECRSLLFAERREKHFELDAQDHEGEYAIRLFTHSINCLYCFRCI